MERENFEHLNHPMFKTHKRSFGEKASDVVTKMVGSWGFILLVGIFLVIWVISNGYLLIEYEMGKPFDPYPFILLNLILSCLAAIHTPIILMSQNRQAQKDRIKMEYDYQINKKSEKEIREIKEILMKKK